MKSVRKYGRAHENSSPDLTGRMRGPACFSQLLFLLVIGTCLISSKAQAQLQFFQAPGGLSGTQTLNNYFVTFGTMNALGIGTPGAGLTVTPLSNGALYFTEYGIQFSGIANGHKASLTAYVSKNFTHPAAMIIETCAYTSACSSAGGYGAMSTSAAAPSSVIAAPGQGNTTVTAGIGIFLPDNNGASAFTGSDTAEVSFVMKDLNNNNTLATANIFFNSPAETVQKAVELTLSTAPGGVAITPATDFNMSFGNVNGLGIGPGAGLSTSPVAGGVVYSTPYLLNAAYSDFTSTTGSLSVAINSNFAHPAVLQLRDSASSAGPFTNISVAPTAITTSAQDRVAVTRYLGLFVSNTNGGAVFTGPDNARLTFTLTVP